MDTTICGATAYQYWRTPPIVRILAAAPGDDLSLARYVGEEELTVFRIAIAEQLPLAKACSTPWRNAGRSLKTIREACPLVAPSAELPVEILVNSQAQRHACEMTRTRYWKDELPLGSVSEIAEDLSVTSPAFTMLQLASSSSVVQTALLTSELCGTYAVYRAPLCIATQLQRMINRGDLPTVDGWRPALSPDGKLTELWSRPPLVSVSDLEDIVARSDSRNGKRTLLQAIQLVKPYAASPFETQAGMLLGNSPRRGGEGFGDFSHNERVDLTSEARLLAQRECCYCDLYWADGLDVECQSAAFHDNRASYISDADRTAALRLVGVEVLPLRHAQLKDPKRFAAFSNAVARALDRPERRKTDAQLSASYDLREELFVDWWRLPY